MSDARTASSPVGSGAKLRTGVRDGCRWSCSRKAAGEATVLEDYSAQELAVTPGEEVTVDAARHEWLLVRNVRGERGWIPASHAKEL